MNIEISFFLLHDGNQWHYWWFDFVCFLDRGFTPQQWHFHQSTHDEQVAVYSCKEFLQGFAFVAIIDFDEIIVHDRFSEYSTFLKVIIYRVQVICHLIIKIFILKKRDIKKQLNICFAICKSNFRRKRKQ